VLLSFPLWTPENERWLLAPSSKLQSTSRKYRDHTLILETRSETVDGVATVIDFTPPRDGHSDLVRIVQGDSGHVRMRMELTLRFDYGVSIPWTASIGEGLLHAISGQNRIVICGGAALNFPGGTVTADFQPNGMRSNPSFPEASVPPVWQLVGDSG
jgi:hypothetical protein